MAPIHRSIFGHEEHLLTATLSWNPLSWAASYNVSAGNKRVRIYASALPPQKSEQMETIS
jgi:hypothetical protein